MIATSTITTETSTGRTAFEELRAREATANNAALTYKREMTDAEKGEVARRRVRIEILTELIKLERRN